MFVPTFLEDEVFGLIININSVAHGADTIKETLELYIDYLVNICTFQAVEKDDVIDSVKEFGSELFLHLLVDDRVFEVGAARFEG